MSRDGSKTVSAKTKTKTKTSEVQDQNQDQDQDQQTNTVRSPRTCMTKGCTSALFTVYFLLIHYQIHFDVIIKTYTFTIIITQLCYQSLNCLA